MDCRKKMAVHNSARENRMGGQGGRVILNGTACSTKMRRVCGRDWVEATLDDWVEAVCVLEGARSREWWWCVSVSDAWLALECHSLEVEWEHTVCLV